MERATEARLEGWNGPFFPNGIDELSHLYRHCEWNGKILIGFGELIDGFVRGDFGIRTTDKYYWFWGIRFDYEAGSACILFPWSEKRTGQEFSAPYRSIAIHTRGDALAENLDYIVRILTERFEQRLTYDVPAKIRVNAGSL